MRSISILSTLVLKLSVASASTALQSPLGSPPPTLVHDLLGFHKNLTEIESISYNEGKAGEWLADSLTRQGYHVRKQCLDSQPSRCNILAWPKDRDNNEDGRQATSNVLLTSHYDTVPPFHPYRISQVNDSMVISGRGSVDDKASVAAQLVAVNNLLSRDEISPKDVSLLFVVGEEKGGEGMRAANSLGLTPHTIIFGEPTERRLVSGHKGSLPVKLTTKGRAVHSGYPWLGRSANEILVRSLAAVMDLEKELPENEKYGRTTFNIGLAEGGVAGNVVAANASARIDVRIADGTPAHVFRQLTRAVHVAVQPFLEDEMQPQDVVDIEMVNSGYAPIDLDADVPGFEVTTVNYGTDIPNCNMSVEGQKRYLYGPGSIFVAHSDHEALTEEELRQSVSGYERLIMHALGKG